MPFGSYKFMFIKIIAAIVSSIAFSLYRAWNIYTPVSERLSNVAYHSFSGIFAFNFVPNFFVFVILGVILSPMIDSIIFRKFRTKGIRGLLTVVVAYLMMGGVGGVLISLFFLSPHMMLKYISVSMRAAMIFLFFQIVFQWMFMKLGSKRKWEE